MVTDPDEGIRPEAVLAALGYNGSSDVRRVAGGWDTLLWRFRTPDGLDRTLRVYVLPDRDEVAARELIALRWCEEHGLPAPRVEGACSVHGLPVAVLTWCPGRPILSVVEKKPWLLWHVSRIFGQMQARLHAVPPPREFLAGAPDSWLYRVPVEYRGLAEHARSLAPSVSSFIHMDYHPLNVIADGGGISGVVDWGGAAAGDPRADLARTHITLETAPVPPGPLRPLFNVLRSLMIRGWRSGYRDVAGTVPEYRELKAWAAATMLAEVERVIGKPGVWGTPDYLRKLRTMIAVWSGQAGGRRRGPGRPSALEG